MVASYCRMYDTGELEQRVEAAFRTMDPCQLCPRHCQVRRQSGERGYCRTGMRVEVSSFGPHFGEEPPLVGSHGSGTIFFTHCSLRCRYCQNISISQGGMGEPLAPEALAGVMVSLQERGCHNINLVTPTHVVPQILEALLTAVPAGLTIPLVYNTGTFDAVGTLKILEGIIDIYMPDAKYADPRVADALSDTPDYPAVMQEAISEMYRQVGDLVIRDGIATRGLLVRHLVLPGGLAGSAAIFEWLSRTISRDTYLNVMDQYRPIPGMKLPDHPRCAPMRRMISHEEYQAAIDAARQYGLTRGIPSREVPGSRVRPG